MVKAVPSVLAMLAKDNTVVIIGVKSISTNYTCSACGKIGNVNCKLMKCDTCQLRQRVTGGSKHWYCKLFVEDKVANQKFYVAVFHKQWVKLTEDIIANILLQLDSIKISYNVVHGKVVNIY